MKYVFHALRMQWRCATQYRASFWMQTLAQLVMSGSELMAVLVLLGRFTSVGQWSGSEIMFFFGMMQMTFAITECVGRGLTAFSRVVQGGESTKSSCVHGICFFRCCAAALTRGG